MACGKRFVKERSIQDLDPGYRCDLCKKQLVRVYSVPGSIFNGSGFYSTDNRKK
jgi:predicted nucleic acid-binding Zn ribbon protein